MMILMPEIARMDILKFIFKIALNLMRVGLFIHDGADGTKSQKMRKINLQ
jgi:hypothetical protein